MPIILSAREAETVSSDKTSSGTEYGVMMMTMMGANGRVHDIIMMEGDHQTCRDEREGGQGIVTLVKVVSWD